MGSFKLIEPFINKFKFYLILYIICILLSYPLESIVIPETFSSFFESLKNTSTNLPNNVFIDFFYKICFFITIIIISQLITSKLDVYLIPEFNEMISNTIFEKIIRHYENNYTDIELGKILTRINGLPSILRELSTDLFTWIVPKILTVIIINYYFFRNNITLGILSSLVLVFIIWNNYRSFKPCVEVSHDRYTKYEDKSEILQDKLSNLYSIYSCGNLKEEINNFKQTTNKFKDIHNKSMSCSHKIKNKNGFLTTLIFITMCCYIVYLYKLNKISKLVSNDL